MSTFSSILTSTLFEIAVNWLCLSSQLSHPNAISYIIINCGKSISPIFIFFSSLDFVHWSSRSLRVPITASPWGVITIILLRYKSIPKYKSYSLYKAGHLYCLCVRLDSVLDWSLKLTPSCSVWKFVYWCKLSDTGYQCAGHCQRSTQSVGGCYDSHRAWLWE